MKQVFHIVSEADNQSNDTILLVRTGERHFGFAVTSPGGQELYKLAWYTGADIEEKELQEIYQKHPELSGEFSRTVVCFDHAHSVLVPQVYYKQEEAFTLLKSLYGTQQGDLLMTEYVEDWQIQNVYAAPKGITDWISRHFTESERWHAYTIGLRNTGFIDPNGLLSADFRPDSFSLLVTKANKLLLAQTYTYSTPADVLYYLLSACQQFGLTQETVQLVLSGLITKESALYKELYNYFLQIKFREPEWSLQGDQQYPSHFFTSLNDLAKCAS